MSKIQKVELTAFSFEVNNLGLSKRGAAGQRWRWGGSFRRR